MFRSRFWFFSVH